jgi:FAD/FMN-containing dehydrogenase
VPTSITLKVLHDVVQAAMGWFDHHLWEFTIGKQRFGLPMEEDWGTAPRKEASKVRLRDVLKSRKTVIDYLYDFGDSWEHRLTVTVSDEVWQAVADKAEVTRDVQTRLHDLAIAFGGTFSAEHGIGRKLGTELRRLIAPAKYQTLLAIKSAIDPRNILNPGVLLSEQTSDTAPPVAER